MKFAQSVELVKLLKEFDENHYFRKINIKKFVKQNNIKHHFVGPVMLIDKEDFFKKINPANIKKSYRIPKIRTMASTVREYNKNELDKINTHTLDQCREQNNKLKIVKCDRLLLINYQEIKREIDIIKYLRNHKFKKVTRMIFK